MIIPKWFYVIMYLGVGNHIAYIYYETKSHPLKTCVTLTDISAFVFTTICWPFTNMVSLALNLYGLISRYNRR